MYIIILALFCTYFVTLIAGLAVCAFFNASPNVIRCVFIVCTVAIFFVAAGSTVFVLFGRAARALNVVG
jgi:hypothetical protein